MTAREPQVKIVLGDRNSVHIGQKALSLNVSIIFRFACGKYKEGQKKCIKRQGL
jgi:hypothetical protein